MKGKGVAKYIHKQLVKPMLPDAVTNRPKQGGFSPLEIFFNTTFLGFPSSITRLSSAEL